MKVALNLSHLWRSVLEISEDLIGRNGIYSYYLVVSHFDNVTGYLITVKLQTSCADMRLSLLTTSLIDHNQAYMVLVKASKHRA